MSTAPLKHFKKMIVDARFKEFAQGATVVDLELEMGDVAYWTNSPFTAATPTCRPVTGWAWWWCMRDNDAFALPQRLAAGCRQAHF